MKSRTVVGLQIELESLSMWLHVSNNVDLFAGTKSVGDLTFPWASRIGYLVVVVRVRVKVLEHFLF